jgi:hypothetical protein
MSACQPDEGCHWKRPGSFRECQTRQLFSSLFLYAIFAENAGITRYPNEMSELDIL